MGAFKIEVRKYYQVQKTCCKRTKLENQFKKLEGKLDKDNLSRYNSAKNELNEIYDHIAGGTRISSKCDWYEHDKELTIFFKNLEKPRGSQNTIKKLVVDDKEITDQTYSRTHQRILPNSFQTTGTKN